MKQIVEIRELFGSKISFILTLLDYGASVLIVGGQKSHIGSVSLYVSGGEGITLNVPSHRESVITGRFARELGKVCNAPVCVECGIHYDNATKEQIDEIMAACDDVSTIFKSIIVSRGVANSILNTINRY
ncbi:MAG: hypothetical protein LBU32_04330 [Clostridiales bacterium]|jgi:hypothetical protein|nr:hypothetical protein [Clostridiales bacterium]